MHFLYGFLGVYGKGGKDGRLLVLMLPPDKFSDSVYRTMGIKKRKGFVLAIMFILLGISAYNFYLVITYK